MSDTPPVIRTGITVNTATARAAIIHIIKAGLVPMLHGSPGGGKSALINSIADEFKLFPIDLRLAQLEPTDMNGFPFPKLDIGKAGYLPMEHFPLESDPIPAGYSGWMVFMDEMNSAGPATQKASYKTLYDKAVGDKKLHKNCVIVCAGNLDTDNAIVEEMSTALQSRLIHLELETDVEMWLDWAAKAGIDHRIMDFINLKNELLNDFDPDHTDKTFACQRTWDFASQLMVGLDLSSAIAMPILAGTLSHGVAMEFIAFTRIYKDLPKIAEIERAPDLVAVPDEPSVLYALIGTLSQRSTTANIPNMLVYVSRLPIEFQVIYLRTLARRDASLVMLPEIQQWALTAGLELM